MTLILYSAVFIAVGIYWIISLKNVNTKAEALVQDRITAILQIQSLLDVYTLDMQDSFEFLKDSIPDYSAASARLEDLTVRIEENWDELQQGSLAMEEAEILNDGLEGNLAKSLDLISSIHKVLNSQTDTFNLSPYYPEILSVGKKVSGNLLELKDRQVLKSTDEEINKTFKEYYDSMRMKVLIIVSIMLIGPGIMAITMIIGIGKSIRQISEALTKISNGDLRIRFHSYGKDELGLLMVKLEQTTEKLQEVISTVRLAAINMSHASNELSSVSQDVAQGASEQASTSEEIASSIEQMAGNIQQTSVNADETDSISGRASNRVKTVHESANTSLQRIVEISEKVSIIGDIAFQTNILSLNAAVEAARAGEHGRGFGVVATEVGKLADRSKNAANEINELSKLTVAVTKESQSLLNQLMPDIEKTSELVKQISNASQEQNQGAGQINIAIQQLSMVTQQNAASSEEMATSAAEMSAQAKQLMHTMSFFNIEESDDIKETMALSEGFERKKPEKQKGFKIDLSEDDSLDKDFVEF